MANTDINDINIDKHCKFSEMEFKDKDLKKLTEKVKKQQC